MNAQQLAGDEDEQSSGYRCSGSSAGVRKCARVRACERRLLLGWRACGHLCTSRSSSPVMEKTTTISMRSVLCGCCASIVCMREHRWSSACGGVQEHPYVGAARAAACMQRLRDHGGYAAGASVCSRKRSNAWINKIKAVGGAELHRGGCWRRTRSTEIEEGGRMR